MWSRLCALLLSLVLGIHSVPVGQTDQPVLCAEAAILICADSGEVLYEKNADRELPIASITKIMTAVIALEYAAENELTVTFTKEMIAEGSSLYLEVGDVLTIPELVKGLMAVSGNDAANAIAFGIDGSQEAFARRMNDKAQQLGMSHTHFVTPSGLDDERHYSSAADMAALSAYAMANERFAAIVSRKQCTVSYVRPEGKTQICVNHNRLLTLCEGCIGIKTGYTRKAGRTLTSCVERNGVRLIAVTLNDSDDWNDHLKLYDYGFAQLQNVTLLSAQKTFLMPVVGGTKDQITLIPETDVIAALLPQSQKRVTYTLFLPHFLYAAVPEGKCVGEICFFLNQKKIASARLFTAEAVAYQE